MWRLVLVLCQILAATNGEDVTDSANGLPLLRVPLTKIGRFAKENNDREQVEHVRARRAPDSGTVRNMIRVFEDMSRSTAGSRGTSRMPQVVLQSYNDLIYTGPIYIGYPKAQRFMVIFDTGSSDIWVPSVESHTSNLVHQKRRKYNSRDSVSHTEDGRLFTISYGSGTITGFTSKDRIKVAGLVIEDQVFGEVTDLPNGTFIDSHIDGVFGLGFKTISRSSPQKTSLDRLKKQGVINKRVFCFHLNNQKAKIDGELIIGGCDVEAEFFLPVKSSGYWQFHMTSIQLIERDRKSKQNQVLLTGCDGGCDVILDTGSTAISGPYEEILKINDLFGAQFDERHNHYRMHCGKTGLPLIVFNFGNNQITLKPKDYVVQVQPGNCVSGFNVLSDAIGPVKYIFGDIILRRVVSIHDMEEERIGFALRKN